MMQHQLAILARFRPVVSSLTKDDRNTGLAVVVNRKALILRVAVIGTLSLATQTKENAAKRRQFAASELHRDLAFPVWAGPRCPDRRNLDADRRIFTSG